MKRRIIVLLFVLVGLCGATQACFADLPGEGYAWAGFKELVRTFILLKGEDIRDHKVADVYGHVIDCDLFKKDYSNDFLWGNIRQKIISRVLKQNAYYRVRYQTVIPFNLKRYDFTEHDFPVVSHRQSFIKVGYLSLYTPGLDSSYCNSGRDPIFAASFMLKLDTPLTISGLAVSDKDVAKIMMRMQEAGNTKRLIYARVRVVVTGAHKGVYLSADNVKELMMTGYVTSVDFFLDPQLTEPIGRAVTQS